MKMVLLLLLVCVAGLALAMPKPFGFEGDDDLDTGEAERREFQALAAQLRALDTADDLNAAGYPDVAAGYGEAPADRQKRLFGMLAGLLGKLLG
ncbi:hypothetical protein ACOMHN_027138 [Nucella lapillus]